jgi:hypothetical protein
VTIGPEASIWLQAVLRGDYDRGTTKEKEQPKGPVGLRRRFGCL